MVIRDLLDKVLINQRLVIIDLNQSATKQQVQWLKINVVPYLFVMKLKKEH